MIEERHVSRKALHRLAQGKAEAAERLELLAHLAQCSECMEQFAQYFDRMEEVKTSGDFVTQTAERIRAERAVSETAGEKQAGAASSQEIINSHEKRMPMEVNRRRKGRGELMRYSAKVSAAACAALILLFTQAWALNGGYQAQGQTKWWHGSPGQTLLEKPIEKIKASEWTLKSLSDHLFKRGGNEK